MATVVLKHPITEADTAALRKSRIGAISVMAKQIGMDEESMRLLFLNLTGKTSRTKMSLAELTKCRDAIVAKGGKLTAPGGGPKAPTRALAVDAQASKLRALWLRGGELGIVRRPTEEALCSWASNSRAANVTALLQTFTGAEFDAAIERLKKWLFREVLNGELACADGHAFPVGKLHFNPILHGTPLLCPDCEMLQRRAVLSWRPQAKPT